MNNRPKDPKTARNKNVLIIGGSGSGKTRFWLKPNLMQCASETYPVSFVVTDPKGSIVVECGKFLLRKGYEVRILNTINFKKSMHYNPFAYLHSEKDILKLVTTLIANTKGGNEKNSGDFWTQAEALLYSALIAYIHYEAPIEEQNFSTLLALVSAMETREDDEDFQNPVDLMFEALEKEKPDCFAVRQYKKYKLAAGKTAKSILISLGVRLEKFNLPQIASVVSHDELNLPSLGDKKTALFAVIPDNDSSLNYIIGMMYTQLFQELFYKADHLHGGRLPVHVHCVMDEFANVALPDEFDKLLSTMRSREVSVSIIIQNLAQLKALFEKQWESIVGNCDEFLYLGGNEQSTHKYVSELLGKSTIDVNTYGQSKGRNGSYSTNWQISGRELYTPDEVRMLDNRYALLFIRGERAVQDDKYNILRHPNIKLTADGGVEPYIHGQAPNALDPDFIMLDGDMGDYELLSETDVEELLKKSETEEQKK